jgi:hypothetical protein
LLRLTLWILLYKTTVDGVRLVAETLSNRRFDGIFGFVPIVITILFVLARIFVILYVMKTMISKVKITTVERVDAEVISKAVHEDKHCVTLQYQHCISTFNDRALFNRFSKGDYVQVILKRMYYNNGRVKYEMELC